MTMRAESADGVIHEFPDGTAPDVIDKAMKSYSATMPKPPSVTADVAKEGGKGLLRGVADFAGDIGEAVMGPFGPGKHAANLVSDITGGERPTPDPTYGQQIAKGAGIEASPQTTPGKFAGTTGEVLGNPASYLGPGGIPAKVLTGAATGVVSEAAGEIAQAAGAGPGVESAARVAGGVLGGKAPSAAARAVTPLPSSAERQAAVQVLANEGINAQTAGQTTGSKGLQYTEHILGDAPGAGGRATASREAVGRQFTAAALRRAGIQGEDLATPQVIDGAFRRIGGEMDAIAARNNAVQDHQFVQDMEVARAEYEATVQQGSRRAVVDHVIDDFNNRLSQSPVITGQQYQTFRSRLTRLQRGAANDPEYSEVLGAYVEAMDGMMERSIENPGDMAAWREARRQYRNLIPLSRASTGGGEQAAEGIITPARLRQVIASGRRGERDYARGRGDFAELTRAGNVILTQLPNSGTAQREMSHAMTGAVGGAGALLLGGSPEAAGAALTAAAAPAVGGRVLMSPWMQQYLSNQAGAGLPQAVPSPAWRSAVTSPLAPQSALSQPTQ